MTPAIAEALRRSRTRATRSPEELMRLVEASIGSSQACGLALAGMTDLELALLLAHEAQLTHTT